MSDTKQREAKMIFKIIHHINDITHFNLFRLICHVSSVERWVPSQIIGPCMCHSHVSIFPGFPPDTRYRWYAGVHLLGESSKYNKFFQRVVNWNNSPNGVIVC